VVGAVAGAAHGCMQCGRQGGTKKLHQNILTTTKVSLIKFATTVARRNKLLAISGLFLLVEFRRRFFSQSDSDSDHLEKTADCIAMRMPYVCNVGWCGIRNDVLQTVQTPDPPW